jgi:GTP-binding protein
VRLFVDCGDEFTGVVTEKISARKGRMVNMTNNGSGRVRMEFSVPSRSLIGYRDEFLTDTKGTGLLNSYLEGYGEHRGEFPTRRTGSIVADRAGSAVAYGLFHLEPRGELFVVPGDPIYDGMIVGERNKAGDIEVNPCKEKKLTNMRASGKDEALTLTPVRPMSLERAIHFIDEDELVEVTPQSIRLRKQALNPHDRRLAEKRKKGL